MEKIKNLLGKFNNLAIPNEEIRNKILDAIDRASGFRLEIKDVSIKDKIAYVSAGGVLKGEIFMKKKKILEELGGEITDIR